MYYISMIDNASCILHSDKKFYLGFIYTGSLHPKAYKTKANADKQCSFLNAKAKETKYFVKYHE